MYLRLPIVLVILLLCYSPTLNAITTRTIRRDTKPSRNTLPQYDPGPVDWIPAQRNFPPPAPWKAIDLSPKSQSNQQNDNNQIKSDQQIANLDDENNSIASQPILDNGHSGQSRKRSALDKQSTDLTLDDEDREFEQQLRRIQVQTPDLISTKLLTEHSPTTTNTTKSHVADTTATSEIQTNIDTLKAATESHDQYPLQSEIANKIVLDNTLNTHDISSPKPDISMQSLTANITVDMFIPAQSKVVPQVPGDVPPPVQDLSQIDNDIVPAVETDAEPEAVPNLSDREVVHAAVIEHTDDTVLQDSSLHDGPRNAQVPAGDVMMDKAAVAESEQSTSSVVSFLCALMLLMILIFGCVVWRRKSLPSLSKHDNVTSLLEGGSAHEQAKPLISSYDEHDSQRDTVVDRSVSKSVKQVPHVSRLGAVALADHSISKGCDDDEGWNDFDRWDD